MRKVMVISILCAVILSACGNVSETAETSEVSQTTDMRKALKFQMHIC